MAIQPISNSTYIEGICNNIIWYRYNNSLIKRCSMDIAIHSLHSLCKRANCCKRNATLIWGYALIAHVSRHFVPKGTLIWEGWNKRKIMFTKPNLSESYIQVISHPLLDSFLWEDLYGLYNELFFLFSFFSI